MTPRALPEEPRWITEPTLLAIHAQQIERYGGAHGVLDQNVVLSANARPLNRWGYDEAADLADLAAAYLAGFAQSQGFNDGSKRTGLACALVFLAINGSPLHVALAELYALMMAVAKDELKETAVAAYLRDRLARGRQVGQPSEEGPASAISSPTSRVTSPPGASGRILRLRRGATEESAGRARPH